MLDGNKITQNNCTGVYIAVNYNGKVHLKKNQILDNKGDGWFAEKIDLNKLNQMIKRSGRTPSQFGFTFPRGCDKISSRKPIVDNDNIVRSNRLGTSSYAHTEQEAKCAHCNVLTAKKLLRCSNCITARYCNVTCSKTHYKIHRPTCLEIVEQQSVLVTVMNDVALFPRPGVKVSSSTKPANRKGKRFIVKAQVSIMWFMHNVV